MEMSGRDLGRYRLAAGIEERPGAVLPARDTLLDRRVGLLLVPAAVASEPARLARIRQEVERAAEFVHPSVSTVYGLEEGDDELFVALELPIGRSLPSLLAAGEPPLEGALEIAATLCDVLAGAKEAGVVHGGLHPGDLVLAEDGAVTVGGFGLHELRLAVEEELGEPSPAAPYRPPESAPGLLPDHRGDLFSLGRLLQEMLHFEEAPVDLPEEAGNRLRQIVERCLSEDPAQRPGSAAELRPILEEAQRELLREPEPEPEPAAEPPWRRLSPRARWAALAAAVLLLGIAGWGLWRGAGGAERAAEPAAEEAAPAAVEAVDLAVMPFATPEEVPEGLPLARGFSEEVTRLLERERSISVVAAGSAATAALDGLGVAQLGRRLGVAHVLEGSFLWQRDAEISRAEVVVRLSRVSDGELLWSETLEGFFGEIVELQDRVAAGVARRLGAGDRRGRRRPMTPSLGAYEAYLEAVGRVATADPGELKTAAAGLEQATMLDPGLLLAHTRQVRLQAALVAGGEAVERLAVARQALAAAGELSPEHPEVRLAAAELELVSGGDPARALDDLEVALARLPGHPQLLHSLALIDRRQGRWDEAIDRLEMARRRAPLDVDLVGELVRTLAWKRRFAEAAEVVDRLAESLPGASEPALLRADLLVRQRGATGEARAVLEGLPEATHADPRWQQRMMRLELYEGDYAAALARLPALQLEEAEELIEGAWIQRHMGRERRAAAGFERARDLLDDRLEARAGDPGLSSLLGQAYAGTGGAHLGDRMGRRAVSQLPVTVDAVAGVELVQRLARIYVLAGDHEHAIDELAFLLEIPSPVTVAVLRLDPTWRPLRQEARFRSLLERFGP